MLACDFMGLVRGSIKKCSHAIKTSRVCSCLGKIEFLEIRQQPELSRDCTVWVVLGNTLTQDPLHFGPFDSKVTLNIYILIRTITTGIIFH